jgi:hypothetical protein
MSPIFGKTLMWFFTQKDFRGQPQNFNELLADIGLTGIPMSLNRLAGRGNKDIEVWQSVLTSMGLSISRYSKMTEIYNLLEKWEKSKGIETNKDFPISRTRDIRNALQDDDLDKAESELNKVTETEQKKHPEFTLVQMRGKILKGLVESLKKPFAGSNRNEYLFEKTLGPGSKDIVRRAHEERIIVLKRVKELYDNMTARGSAEASDKNTKEDSKEPDNHP